MFTPIEKNELLGKHPYIETEGYNYFFIRYDTSEDFSVLKVQKSKGEVIFNYDVEMIGRGDSNAIFEDVIEILASAFSKNEKDTEQDFYEENFEEPSDFLTLAQQDMYEVKKGRKKSKINLRWDVIIERFKAVLRWVVVVLSLILTVYLVLVIIKVMAERV